MVTRPKIRRGNKIPRTQVMRQPSHFQEDMGELFGILQELDRIKSEQVLDGKKRQKEWDAFVKRASDYVSRVKKGDPGRDAPSLSVIVSEVLKQIPTPKNGKDANEVKIAERVLKLIPKAKVPSVRDIVSKVRKMIEKADIKLSIDNIKGLREELRTLSSQIGLGGGGGGMGTIKYFKFSGDGSTTEFTLPDSPTQEGAATFAFYQGQRLHNDEHFTVSGKTISLTFTPDEDTFVDGWIIT